MPGVPGAGARSVWLRFVIVSCYYLVSQLGLHSPHPGPGNRSGKHQERKNLQIYFFKGIVKIINLKHLEHFVYFILIVQRELK